jgi:hypothetical protein
VVSESIEKRGGELLVAGEDGDPFGKRQIRGDDDASSLVALCDEVEEQLATGAIEGHESYLVDDQEFDVLKPSMQTRELTLVARFDERADEIGGPREQDSSSPARRLDSERDREVRLARADRRGRAR